MSTAVAPIGMDAAMGTIRAAAFAEKLKKKSKNVNHDTRTMFMS
jgi:hypothetical protein